MGVGGEGGPSAQDGPHTPAHKVPNDKIAKFIHGTKLDSLIEEHLSLALTLFNIFNKLSPFKTTSRAAEVHYCGLNRQAKHLPFVSAIFCN